MKQWLIGDLSAIEFRTEFFNSFNWSNFNLPINDFNNPNFGRVNSAKDSRQIQFGLRLRF